MQWRIAIGLLVGCGSVSTKPDAASDGVPGQDSSSAECDRAKPFAAAVQVMGIHDAGFNDNHATLAADELTIYFGSDRAGGGVWHIYTATRLTRSEPFGMPMLLGSTFSMQGEAHPSVSPDGNTIYFDSFRVTAGTVHIFTSTRSSAAVQFPPATMIVGDYLIDPAITSDGSVLYAANLSSGGLVRMDRAGSGFGTPQPVALPSAGSVVSPVTNDDLTMFMSFGDTTGNQIAVTQRASTSVGFPMPMAVAELAITSTLAEPSWFSADGCRLYLTYTMMGGKQTIYVATRPQ